MRIWVFTFLAFTTLVSAKPPELERAKALYERTEYTQSLNVLLALPQKDAAIVQLIGQNYFMMGEYKKATDALEHVVALDPTSATAYHWLGRAYGRRAETANYFLAPGYANIARRNFEKAVQLDPSNSEAVNDLFDYYLEAPGFLGGGLDKAEKLAQQIGQKDAAEGHYAMAQLEEKRKEYDSAEQHLRRAAELAPKQVGRVVDIAMFLSKRGRLKESEAMFDKASTMAPDSPKVMFDRANTYIKEKRNLEEARRLLEKYMASPVTPDDPPKSQAAMLLKKIGG